MEIQSNRIVKAYTNTGKCARSVDKSTSMYARMSASVCDHANLSALPLPFSSTIPYCFISGALCDVSDVNGVCPLHVACDRGHADIVQLLCDIGAEINRKTRDSLCPLHLACRCFVLPMS